MGGVAAGLALAMEGGMEESVAVYQPAGGS